MFKRILKKIINNMNFVILMELHILPLRVLLLSMVKLSLMVMM
jgi:hypothetical protein